MHRNHSPDHAFVPQSARATEHSIPFSDLRADTDTKLLRIWFDTELEPDSPYTWQYLDIARGGLSIVTKLEATPHNNTRQNSELLRKISLSAFTLYQPDKLTDDDGNLLALALHRDTPVHLGQTPKSPFDALRGSALAPDHLGLYVDDDDILTIEGYEVDNLPQIEVIAADSDTAVHIGLSDRDYLFPRGVRTGDFSPTTLRPLSAAVRAVSPQLPSISTAEPIADIERILRSNR